MPSIKITDFKGILTDADPNTIPFEYVKESRNVRYYSGYAKTEFLDKTAFTTTTSNILWSGYVWFKEDYLSKEFKGQYTKKYLEIREESFPFNGETKWRYYADDGNEFNGLYGYLGSSTGFSSKAEYIKVTNYNGEVQIVTNLFYKKLAYYDREIIEPQLFVNFATAEFPTEDNGTKVVKKRYYILDMFPECYNSNNEWTNLETLGRLQTNAPYFRIQTRLIESTSASFALWDKSEYEQCKFLLTYTYDGKNEIVAHKPSPAIATSRTGSTPYFHFNAILKKREAIPDNITAVNLYIKLKSKSLGWDLDFTRVAVFDLTKQSKEGYTDDGFFKYKFNALVSASTQGATLSSAIGVYWDEENPPKKIISGVQEYKEIIDVAFVRTQESVFPCVIGNGLVQKGNFYYNTQVPVVNSSRVDKMVEINSDIGVVTNDSLKVFKIDNYEGVLVFTPKGELPYKIYDVWEIGGQLFMVTPVGILVTGGDSVDNISRPIADKIRADYENIKVAYNKFKAEVYAVMEGLLYVYDYKTQTWTSFDLPELNFKEFIKTEEDPKLGFQNKIYDIKFVENSELESKLVWHNTNLNEMRFYKKIDKILFESLTSQDTEVVVNGTPKTIKPITVFSFVKNPFEKFDIEIKGNFTLYNMEVLFDVIPKQWNSR